jgi:glycosyltransferase involved in cell wall biosynthesis
MHVLIVQKTANSTTFGWEQGLERLGHRVTVLTATEKRQFGGRPGAEIVSLPNSGWSERLSERSMFFLQRVAAFPNSNDAEIAVRKLGPDTAIVKVDTARNLVLGRALTRIGIPWVAWQEQLPPLSRRWALSQRLGVRPDAVFTALDSRPGGVALASAETALPRISYVPYDWQAMGANGPRQQPPAAPLRVLVVASFKNHHAKSQWSVIEAAASAGLLDGSMRFTFVGQGRTSDTGYQRVTVTAREYGADHLVELVQNVTFQEMHRLYKSHDLLVLPSLREQFGMAIVEAMEHGLPVIVSDTVGAIGCVRHAVNGLVFPVSNVMALGEHLRLLADDQELRLRLGVSARTFVEKHLNPVETARAILKLLSSAPC